MHEDSRHCQPIALLDFPSLHTDPKSQVRPWPLCWAMNRQLDFVAISCRWVSLSIAPAADMHHTRARTLTHTHTLSDINGFRSCWVHPLLDPAGLRLTGVGDKGLADSSCKRLMTPHKEDAMAIRLASIECVYERRREEVRMRKHNTCLSSYRIRVECSIGDFMKWAAARGRTSVLIAVDPVAAQQNIKLCVMLTNMIYRFRRLG